MRAMILTALTLSLGDQKFDMLAILGDRYQFMAGSIAEMFEIQRRGWVGRNNPDARARLKALYRLARLKHRERTFKATRIDKSNLLDHSFSPTTYCSAYGVETLLRQ